MTSAGGLRKITIDDVSPTAVRRNAAAGGEGPWVIHKETNVKKKTKKSKKSRRVAPAAKPATVLILRTCNKDMTTYGGFKWPTSGEVVAPDWKPNAECGNGLHGLLWGEGNG